MNDNQLDSLLKKMCAESAKASEPQLPGAGQVWFRAQIRRKLGRRRRIERPLIVMRGIAVTICLAAALLFAGEMREAAIRSYARPLLAFLAIAAVAAFLLAIWPAEKSKLQRR